MEKAYTKKSSFSVFPQVFLILIFAFISSLLPLTRAGAQTGPDFKISGYADMYYAYDNDNSGSNLRQFSVISPIRDQFRINLAQLTGTYTNGETPNNERTEIIIGTGIQF